MNRRKLLCLVCLGLLVVGFSLPSFACEFGKPFGIMVQAPLDAVNCGATPPTVTVLGRNIDISLANLFSDGHGGLTCSDLTAGQVVKVTLASDNPVPSTGNLLASSVELEGGGCPDSHWGGRDDRHTHPGH